MASADSRGGDEELPAAEEVRRLLETGASYDWKADPMDANMAQVRPPPAGDAPFAVLTLWPPHFEWAEGLLHLHMHHGHACALAVYKGLRVGRGARGLEWMVVCRC